MKIKHLLTLLILSSTVVTMAQAQTPVQPVPQPAPVTQPAKLKSATPSESKTHYVRKPHTKIVRMQHHMLFSYPNPHPAYIVTFTEEDMKRFHQPPPKALQSAAYAHRGNANVDEAITAAAN